jgi:hypothetical protein
LEISASSARNHADRERTTIDLNRANLVTRVLPYAAQYPYLHFIDYWYNGGRSNHQSLQATPIKRLSHRFSCTVG